MIALTRLSLLTLLSFAGASGAQNSTSPAPDAPLECFSCAEWNAPREPFRIFGNTYFVGVGGLSAVLIASDAGLVLVDAALPQSVPLIERNIGKLGFRIEDVRLIVNSHEHYDHAGGIAAVQEKSGAAVAASAPAARALEQGFPTPDDPQYGSGQKLRFARVKNVKVIADRETLRVGSLVLTAHLTPGHTPGATTWTWRSCEGERCVDVVYADSLTPVSDDGFRFSRTGAGPSVVERFRRSIAAVEQLPCDVLLSPHPGFIDLDGKLARWKEAPGTNPFIAPWSCRTYAAVARKRLDARLAEEAK